MDKMLKGLKVGGRFLHTNATCSSPHINSQRHIANQLMLHYWRWRSFSSTGGQVKVAHHQEHHEKEHESEKMLSEGGSSVRSYEEVKEEFQNSTKSPSSEIHGTADTGRSAAEKTMEDGSSS